ncbi:MAG TPA: NUDIX domain-containing protein [Ktedonobacterales bacterium]|jgi:8-oxo-dGTP pyrophosphatase MutT (NUDIX family)
MDSSDDTRMDVTWDGLPVSRESPYGCSVVVYRRAPDGLRLLMLHRAHLGRDFAGDWAWTPPGGARLPGEPVDDCAQRELLEETGLPLPPRPTAFGDNVWCVYVAEAAADTVVTPDAEHDRFAWLAPDEALRRTLPERPRVLLRRAVEAIEADQSPD